MKNVSIMLPGLLAAMLLPACVVAADAEEERERYGLGREVTQAEIAEWDDDVMPDGTGLPEGRGSVSEGEQVYRQQCASCHGPQGEGGPEDQLVGTYEPGVNFSRGDVTKTIGNFWPYATTLFDYINRAMPFTQPGSLTPDETYAVTAWLLHQNGIVEADAVLDAQSLPAIDMPARELFYRSEDVPSP